MNTSISTIKSTENRAVSLHPAQQLWLQTQSSSDLAPVIGATLVLRGQLEPDRIIALTARLAHQFDVFCWRVGTSSGQPVPYWVKSAQQADVAVVACRCDQSDHEANAWIQERMKQPFGDCLIDFSLIRVSATEHWLLARGHALLTDHAGLAVLLRYVAISYARPVSGRYRPEGTPAYADALTEAMFYPGSLAYSEDRTHWKKSLPDIPGSLIPVRRADVASHALSLSISDDLTHSLNRLTASTGATAQQALIAALAICFARAGNRAIVPIGRVVSGRQQRQQTLTPGRFDRILPMGIPYQPEQTLRSLLTAIRNQQRADDSHRDFSVGDLWPYAPLGGWLPDVVVESVAAQIILDKPGITAMIGRVADGHSLAPLHLQWVDTGLAGAVQLNATFRASRLTEADVWQLLHRLHHLLSQFEHRPDAPLSSLTILPATGQTYRKTYRPAYAAGQRSVLYTR